MEKASIGQLHDFFGKLLAKCNEDKIAKIDKTKIQPAISLLNASTDDTIVDNFIRFINNGCNPQFIGNHEIDTDKNPNSPFDGATIEQHQAGGKLILDFSKINFYLSEKQKTGVHGGHDLRKELEGKNVMNACVLDYLLANPHLIPEDWKKDSKGNTRFIFFWGTIFRHSNGDLFVRCLCFNSGKWQTDYRWLGDHWDVISPAAVSAS